ncbi:membrane protein insertase YidC [Corynebacterium sp. 335C]
MLTVLVYAVSAIMLFWHWLLAGAFGVPRDIAWVASVFLLVVTVRSAVAPLTWIQLRNGRAMANLRPELHRLKEKWSLSPDPDAGNYLKWAQQKVRQDNDVSLRAGCIAPLVQIPVILGLYQMIARMSRAKDHSGVTVGFLDNAHVEDFLGSRFLDVPLPVYYSMPEFDLERYGTTFGEAAAVLVPLILAATILTTSNLAYSLLRMRRTLDWSSAMSLCIARLTIILAMIGGAFPLLMGFFGPAPLALAIYWVFNNLWTVAQSVIMMAVINRRWPLTEEFLELNDELHGRYGPSAAKRRRHRQAKRRHRAAEKEAARQGKKLRPRPPSEKQRLMAEAARKRAIVRLMRPSGQSGLELPAAGAVPVTGGATWIEPPAVPPPSEAGRRPRPPTKYVMPGQHVPPEVLAQLHLSGRPRPSLRVRMNTPAKGWR